MGSKEQRQAAKKFREYWLFHRPGSEKSGCQQYWNMLLGEVLGMENLESAIRYEVPVTLSDSTKFLDAWIPSTRVLIEQKSRGIKLDAPQAAHDGMTPFEQAKFYDDHRPYDEKARWIVTSNFDEIWIYDQSKPLDPPEKLTLDSLPKEAHRLAFLGNAEVKKLVAKEVEISVQAGRLVGKLYDALLKLYAEPNSPETLKSLNKLCVRLVFCLYAEDADIFDKNLFRKLVSATDPAHLRRAILAMFNSLDTPLESRDRYLEAEYAAFPYANGGLFRGATESEIPPLTEEIKTLLLDASNFDWSGISPTIFGALFESTLNPATRRSGGMVYTSVENIHKVIDPLFLDDLEARFNAACELKVKGVKDKRLLALQDEMASLTILDPACGSGNFLTETFLSFRRLENRIIAELQRGQGELDLGLSAKVSIDQFHGIEINDFAVTVAKTAMWISEAKMLKETSEILHRDPMYLPLKDYDGVVEGNALRMDWQSLLRRTGSVPEARFNYIIGNPPFIGYSNQSSEQKDDILSLYVDEKGKPYKTAGKIDYVSGWYWKAAMLMRGTSTRAAFVSTNSITQGEQVAAVWKPLMERFGLEIDFAWRTFRWDSEANEKAHVHCVIIGFSDSKSSDKRTKLIFDGDKRIEAKHINGYLADGPDVWIESRNDPLSSSAPELLTGGKPTEGGNLILTEDEMRVFVDENPMALKWIRPYMMGKDFIDRKPRYCLWLVNVSPAELRSCKDVLRRVEAVKQYRLKSPKAATRERASTPTTFEDVCESPGDYIAIAKVSSERRDYVPMDYISSDVIPGDSILFIPNATLYHFGVLTSSVHMAWMRTVCGRLKSDYRYSAAIVYNNFPWPTVSDEMKAEIEKTAQAILDARAKYPDSSLADLYDPLTMPPELRKAHAANDASVMKAYGFASSLTEPEIVSRLFALYAKLT